MVEGDGNSSDFFLGAVMGVGCGIFASVLVVSALVYFAPQILGIAGRSDKSAEVIQKVIPGAPSKASPFLR